ncbi:PilZ domain-containing protein [Thioflavicoccus mobilis 8321]|uniref:PilZ domain-containing protein n=1 Tax=Thioflavicoccus mobilis 8321 TaxID=765912 RepID=L0GU33_9GAMM|nr:PilZ domain-containing protein [Thioflavicoccus mobilis]AGA89471.1 PilZ domain-containing protein [Thioflavicoccus mobilis 8321]
MSVERRYSTRFPVDLRVHILYRRRRFSYARARNLSEQGMYLDVQAVTLPSGTLVDLELQCLGKIWLIPAIVVHHQGGGIGVMFRDPQPELYRGLLENHRVTFPPHRPTAPARKQSSLY